MAVKRHLNVNGCAIVNISGKLSEVSTKLTAGQYDFDTAQKIVDELHQEAINQGVENKFAEYLAQNNLTDYNFSYTEGNAAPQLVLKQLDCTDPTLFRYHDTTKNKVDALFSHDVFANLFLNRSRSFKGNPYITSAFDFNRGVVNFKQQLCQNLINELNLEQLKGVKFFDNEGAVSNENGYTYRQLMNAPEIGRWLSYKLKNTLADPIKNDSDLKVLYALYALNNFDTLLKHELAGLVNIAQSTKGTLSNTQYASKTEGNTTEYWADDSHEAKDIRNYTSNIAKFIVKQIPKAIKVGKTYKVIPGQYLGANDLYVLGDILRKAKMENLVKGENNTFNTVDNFRQLFANRTKLPAFGTGKLTVLDSIENFLYNSNDPELYSISELFKNNIEKNLKILDIEGLLAFEAGQSYAPTYVDFDENLDASDTNYGGKYQTGSMLKENLTDFIFQQLQSKSKRAIISKDATKSNFNIDQYDDLLNNRIFRLNEQYDIFKNQHRSEITKLVSELSKLLHENASYKSTVSNARKQETPAEMRTECESIATSIMKTAIKDSKTLNTFKQDYANLVSEIPQVQFTANSGNTMPVYRIQSALSQLDWFIHQYITTQHNRGQNFLADHPQLLTKYNDVKAQNGVDFNANKNQYYKDYVSFNLGVGNNLNYTDYRKLGVADQLGMSYLKGILDLQKGLLNTQIAAYSDKSSIGTICTNIVSKLYGTKKDSYNGSSLLAVVKNPTKGINTIQSIDYQYRKNAMLSRINSILTKWNKIKPYFSELESFDLAPITDLRFTESSGITDFNSFMTKLNNLQTAMTQLTANKSKDQNADVFRKLVAIANEEGFDFIDELDYVKNKDNSLKFNQAILADFQTLQSFQTFKAQQEKSIDALFNSEEYIEAEKNIEKAGSLAAKDSNLYKLLFEPFGNGKDSLAKRKWDKSKNSYVVTLNKDLFRQQVRIQTALNNLVRYSVLDLVSKHYYLDPAKNPNNEISSRIDAMSKRMVLYPATIQPFMQGRFDGVSEEMKFAVITDSSEKVWNISGKETGQKIFDGCGFTSPFYSKMETNSLPGQGVRGTKKTLGTSTVGQNSSLFKWAETPITNEKIRNSIGGKYSLLTLFKKMHSEPLGVTVNLTEDFFGNSMIFPGQLIKKNMYVRQGLDYAQITTLDRNEDGSYEVTYQPVTDSGKTIGEAFSKTVNINTIYDLWEALGGIDSYELSNGKLAPSENSIDATFEYIIRVGQLTDDIENIEHISQSNLFQPLRNKFTAIAVFQGAVKRGSANLNFVEDVFNSDSELHHAKFNTVSFGKQLDANHHSDQADIREMTQTISTLAANGHTYHLAEEAYNEIGSLVEESIKKLSRYLTAYEQKGLEESIHSISESLVNTLSKEADTGSTKSYIDLFMTKMQTTMLPISDRRFYQPFVKSVLESLNKSAIRRRYSGLGGILNPTSNIFQVYELTDTNGNTQTYTRTTLLNSALDWARKTRIIPGRNAQTFQDWYDSVQNQRSFENFVISEYLKANFGAIEHITKDGIAHLGIPITNQNGDIINDSYKILDTLSINGNTVTLDSVYKYLDAKDAIAQKSPFVFKLLDAPHDLRPQIISWKSLEYDKNGDVIESKLNDCYSTTESRLAFEVGKQLLEQTQIDELLADLADEGNDIKNICNV